MYSPAVEYQRPMMKKSVWCCTWNSSLESKHTVLRADIGFALASAGVGPYSGRVFSTVSVYELITYNMVELIELMLHHGRFSD